MPSILRFLRKKMRNTPQQLKTPEDIALEAIGNVLLKIKNKELTEQIVDTESLLRFILLVADGKVKDYWRYLSRKKRSVRPVSLESVDEVAAPPMAPYESQLFTRESVAFAFTRLRDLIPHEYARTRQVIDMRGNDESIEAIAAAMDISTHDVARRIDLFMRFIWEYRSWTCLMSRKHSNRTGRWRRSGLSKVRASKGPQLNDPFVGHARRA